MSDPVYMATLNALRFVVKKDGRLLANMWFDFKGSGLSINGDGSNVVAREYARNENLSRTFNMTDRLLVCAGAAVIEDMYGPDSARRCGFVFGLGFFGNGGTGLPFDETYVFTYLLDKRLENHSGSLT